MKIALSALCALLPTLTLASPWPPRVELPKDRLLLTAYSDSILLVEVTSLKVEDPQKARGLEVRDFAVHGRVIEKVRGEWDSNQFVHSGQALKIVDRKAFDTAFRSDSGWLGNQLVGYPDDGRMCEAKKRYVVIDVFHSMFFVEVTKANADWRKRIKPYLPTRLKKIREPR